MGRVGWVGAVLGLVVPAVAHGAVVPGLGEVADEADLLAASQRGDLSTDTLESLLQLLQVGVDLATASADELFEVPGLTRADVDHVLECRTRQQATTPEVLVACGALTFEQARRLAPWLRTRARLPLAASLRAVGAYALGDLVAPPFVLGGRLEGPWGVSLGAQLALSRHRPASPSWSTEFGALTTPGDRPQLELPRFFAQWRIDRVRLIAGTFHAGFGERLVLDTTRRAAPSGFVPATEFRRPLELSRVDVVGPRFETPDFVFREAFRGVAASVQGLSWGAEELALHGFASYQARSAYQYEVYDRRTCDDPHDDVTSCRAPPVYLPDGSSRVSFETLPNLFDEVVAGGHVELRHGPGLRFGVTGFGSVPWFHAAPAQLDFRPSSRWPNGGAFGAVGLNVDGQVGLLRLALEAARSFDHAAGNQGGGWAVVQRTTFSPRHHEVELTLRAYDVHWLNPYGHAVAAPDEFEGQRGRNEVGARLAVFSRPTSDWLVHSRVEAWTNPVAQPGLPAGSWNVAALTRLELTGSQLVRPALWGQVRTRALGVVCTPDLTCETGVYRLAARLDWRPRPGVFEASTQAWLAWVPSAGAPEALRNDVMVWAELRSAPHEQWLLRVRGRYLVRGVAVVAPVERSVWALTELAWLPVAPSPRGQARLAFRYDLVAWLNADGLLTRTPNPEHRISLDLSAAF